MPVLYNIDSVRGRIHTRCVGYVTLDEVLGHFQALTDDSTCPDRLDVLLDLSGLTSIPDSSQLHSVSSTIGGVSGRVRFEACAIVAKRTALFGVMRMFEVIAQDRFGITQVFGGEIEAVEWLETRRLARMGR